ncbi:MAG: hypothetical protein U1E14_16410 [Geminicoccaceae bacterium]
MTKEEISAEKIMELRSFFAHLDTRKTEAKRILASRNESAVYFAIVGLNCSFDCHDMGCSVLLRRVPTPPNDVELARALLEPHWASTISRFSGAPWYELCIPLDISKDRGFLYDLGLWILAMMRVRSLIDVLVLASASHSWSVVAAIPSRQLDVTLIEDMPNAWIFRPNAIFGAEDARWVSNNIVPFVTLLSIPQFRLAVDSITTFQHQANL